jgi:MFS family permease
VGVYTMVAPDGGWPLSDHRMWPFLGVGGTFAFMAGAFGPSALASLADVSHKKKRGMTMGLYSFVISAAMTVGPILSGAVIDRWGGSGVLAFMTSIAMLMLALVLVQWYDRRRSAWEEGGGEGGGEAHGGEGAPDHGDAPPR